MSMFHDGHRALQAQFGSTALADRLEERLRRERFNDDDKAFIEAVPFFLLATADAQGRPDCSFKGGRPGFVRIAAPDLLVFPDYGGNGMFRSLGNIHVNPGVGMLFITMGEAPKRLRINGSARVSLDDPLRATFPGAQAVIRVTPRDTFPNCPRYIPNAETGAVSDYAPEAGVAPKEPA
jgi:predicted pyridoxine 5'-phosphate oxidase superfamily flavin-nucleotide-binding protein